MFTIKKSTVYDNDAMFSADVIIKSSFFGNIAFSEYDGINQQLPTVEIIEVIPCYDKGLCFIINNATTHKIGNTTFIVLTSFGETATETVEDMLVRYVANQISGVTNNNILY